MKPFDDRLLEEQEPQHEKLITLLRRAYGKPVVVQPPEQARIIARVRERLGEAHHEGSLDEDISPRSIAVLDSLSQEQLSEEQGATRQAKPATRSPRRHALWRGLSLVAAVLVAALLVSSLLLILQMVRGTGGEQGQAAVYFLYHSTVWKVDASTGKVAWSFPTGLPDGSIETRVQIESGRVYVVGETKADAPVLFVLSAQTGRVLQRYALPKQHQVPSLFFGSEHDIYLLMANVSSGGQLGQEEIYVIDERNGMVRKKAALQGCPSALPWTVAQDVIYSTGHTSTTSFLCASRLTDGTLLYRIPASPGGAPRNIMLTQPQVVNGVLYAIGQTELGPVTNYVYAFNARTGAQIWRSAFVPAEFISSIQVVQESVYLTTNDGQVLALNAASGKVRWYKRLQAGSFFQVIDGIMYVATFPQEEPANAAHAQSIYALSARDGAVLWQRLLKAQGGSLYPTGFFAFNGTIYIGSIDGRSDQAHLDLLKATDGSLAGQSTLSWVHIDPSVSGFDFSVAP